jgi:hypothetical protein
MATAKKDPQIEFDDFRLDSSKWRTLRNALADGRPVKINPYGDVFGADTELGNYRTLGKCHLARRSLGCPEPPVAKNQSCRSRKTLDNEK